MGNITVIGCDPGKNGAICVLKLNAEKKPKIWFIDHNKNTKEAIFCFLKEASNKLEIRMSMLEDVHSLPIMTAKSNFVFGKNLGIVETLLELQSFGLDTVTPKIWQKYIGIRPKPKGVKKRSSAELKKEVSVICERLYPECDIRGNRGGLLDGRSDALMIAHYCAHKYK